ncbi:unnamed protein product [Pylaiella littoralis]
MPSYCADDLLACCICTKSTSKGLARIGVKTGERARQLGRLAIPRVALVLLNLKRTSSVGGLIGTALRLRRWMLCWVLWVSRDAFWTCAVGPRTPSRPVFDPRPKFSPTTRPADTNLDASLESFPEDFLAANSGKRPDFLEPCADRGGWLKTNPPSVCVFVRRAKYTRANNAKTGEFWGVWYTQEMSWATGRGLFSVLNSTAAVSTHAWSVIVTCEIV